jgi:hypothetical protein
MRVRCALIKLSANKNAYKHTCTRTNTYKHIQTHTHTYKHIQTHAHTHTHTHPSLDARTGICSHPQTWIYSTITPLLYLHTHTYITAYAFVHVDNTVNTLQFENRHYAFEMCTAISCVAPIILYYLILKQLRTHAHARMPQVSRYGLRCTWYNAKPYLDALFTKAVCCLDALAR